MQNSFHIWSNGKNDSVGIASRSYGHLEYLASNCDIRSAATYLDSARCGNREIEDTMKPEDRALVEAEIAKQRERTVAA